ncbi:MAG: cell division protein ZapA [Bacteroidales bacterium]|jgi:cell division protein ZapA (FtsZ GTPase activity inhibitor)|nr:cell division protein ZapA [Bacteroidales bacterium]HPH53737.1 cell division protein ZapA [Bacteroidales bacterium]
MKQRINIRIAGKEFELDVEATSEEKIREAVKRINQRIFEKSTLFPMVARDEILSMILLEEEVRLVEFETLRDKEKEKLLQQLHNLDERLGEYLIGR